MNDSKRIVSVFMAVGLALAIGVGVAVWKMSSPTSSADPAYQADAAEPSTTERTSQPVMRGATSPESTAPTEGEAADNTQSPEAAGNTERDPLLPPNAVVNPAPRAATPTRVYRPSNVVPTSVAAPQGDALGTDLAPAGPTGQAVEPFPTAPAEAAPETPAPAAPPSTPATAPTDATVPASPGVNSTDVQNPAESAPAEQLAAPQQLPDPVEQALPPTSTDPKTWWDRLQQVFQ